MTRILVVEDSALIQMATKLIFKSFDCVVDFAKTGKETLNLLKNNHYDIVLLDLGLPDMSGIDLVKKYGEKAYSKIKLVALTAHRSEDYKEICLKAGMNGFYTKPLTPQNISELLTSTPTLLSDAEVLPDKSESFRKLTSGGVPSGEDPPLELDAVFEPLNEAELEVF